jgi:Acyl-CoA synthetases (AMP-forming)/AMP-acid ligases II
MVEFLQRVHRLTEPQRRLLRLRLGGKSQEREGEPRLVGYVVPETGGAVVAQDLRKFLAARLPDYMVPGTWVFLDAFPLTSRGKVDRTALLDLARKVPDVEPQSAAPRSDGERAIAAIWAEVLGLPSVGLSDNFFDLGGHSLLLPKVLAKVRALARREVAMVDLFRYPTVQTLAAFVAGGDDPVTTGAPIEASREKREAAVRRMRQQRRHRQSSSGAI